MASSVHHVHNHQRYNRHYEYVLRLERRHPMNSVRRTITNLVRRAELALEIKHHGRYSVGRLVALSQYHQRTTHTNKPAVIAIALTPLPALIALILIDLPELAPPEAGWHHNHRFWVRITATAMLMVGSLLLQLQCFLPRLHVTRRQTIMVTTLTSCTATAFAIFLSSQIGFPLPFTLTIPGPVIIACISMCAYVAWGDQLRRHVDLRFQLQKFVTFLNVQYVLVLVYPMFAFVFNRSGSGLQTLLACSLSVIKLIMKAWLGQTMTDSADLRPIFLTFNVDVFHALFVACCMQNAVSLSTTAVVMALDAYHSWRNLRHLTSKMKLLTSILEQKSAAGDGMSISEFDLVAFVVHLVRDPAVFKAVEVPQLKHPHEKIWFTPSARNVVEVVPAPVFLSAADSLTRQPTATGLDMIASLPSTLDAATRTRLDALSMSERVEFANRSLNFLHFTEHVVLAEYIEVVVPVIYALYLATIFRLHNKQYYLQLRDMTEASQVKAITSVLAYALLELVSFIILDAQLRRKLQFPPLRQLAFVLGHHWWLLPAKLVLWVTFVVQSSLVHCGADYTFRIRTKLHALWSAAHLKTQGQYSVDRLRALSLHLQTASPARSFLVLLWTPFPALAVVAGADLFLLAPPEDGFESVVFWVRVWTLSNVMIGTLMLQLRIFLPGLNMRLRDISVITVFAATTGCMVMVALASQIGFPLPFTITIVSPYTMTCLCSCTAFRYGRQMLSDETLRRQLLEYGIFMSVQYTVTLVYPVFAFTFMQTESVVLQTLLACLLPLVKLLIKMVMSHAMPSLPELRPAFLMFNVEVFNALFISSCLQNASSVVTTIIVMALDMFYNMMTLRDVSKRLSALRSIVTTEVSTTDESGIARRGATASAVDLIECAAYLVRDETIRKAVISHASRSSVPARIHVQSFAQVLPTPTQQAPESSSTGSRGAAAAVTKSQKTSTDSLRRDDLDNLTSEQKVALVRGVLQLLYVTEYVILTEYVEVVVPAIYAVFLAVVYHLPNRQYYPQLRDVTVKQHSLAVQRVLVYALLELVSFLIFQRLLLRKMKLNPVRQLGFVLLEQCWFLPGKLMLWVAFILQCSIEHYGVDYTFQFKWLRAGYLKRGH